MFLPTIPLLTPPPSQTRMPFRMLVAPLPLHFLLAAESKWKQKPQRPAAQAGTASAIHPGLPRPWFRLPHLARLTPTAGGGAAGGSQLAETASRTRPKAARRPRGSAPPAARAGSRGAAGAAVGDVAVRSARRGPGGPGRLAAGRPLLLGAGRPLRPGGGGAGGGGRGRPGDPAPVPGAAAVGGPPGSVPAEQRAQQPRPALLRRAQRARAGAGRAQGADPLQEVRGPRGGRPGGAGQVAGPLAAPPSCRGERSQGGWPGGSAVGGWVEGWALCTLSSSVRRWPVKKEPGRGGIASPRPGAQVRPGPHTAESGFSLGRLIYTISSLPGAICGGGTQNVYILRILVAVLKE